MAVMTTQPPLPFAPVANSQLIGEAVAMTENEDGGQVFIYGTLSYVWDAQDEAMRRMVAVRLWQLKAAAVAEIRALVTVESAVLKFRMFSGNFFAKPF